MIGIYGILEKAKERVTEGLRNINTDHAYIHDGLLFTAPVFISALAAAGTSKITFKTPASGKYVHYRPAQIVSSGDKVTINLYEASLNPVGGNEVTPINRRRINPIASTCEVKTGVTVDNGTLIDKIYIGGGTGVGGATSGAISGSENEIVLKQDTLHTIEVINGSSAANNIFLLLKWYEEDGV